MRRIFKLSNILYCFIVISICPPCITAAQQNTDEKMKQEETEKTQKEGKKEVSSMDEVEVRATKIGAKASQVTDTVVVVDEEAIRESGITDTTDLLRYTPAVQFKRSGGPGQYVYTKMRGFSDGHFAVVIDGMKVTEAMGGGTGNLFSKLDPSSLQRMELLHGPQTTLYGADTTAGVMAFTTKGGEPGFHANIGAEYGTYGWMKETASIRGTEGAFRYALNVANVDSKGIIKHEDYENLTPHVKLGWGKGDIFDAELSAFSIRSKWNYAMLKENGSTVSDPAQLWAFQIPDPSRYNEEDYDLATLNFKNKISDRFSQKLMLGWYKKETESNNPNNGLLGYITAPTDNFTLNYVNYYSKGQTVPVYDDGDGKPYWYRNENYQADYNFQWDQKGSGYKNVALLGLSWIDQKGEQWGKYGIANGRLETKSVYVGEQLLLAGDAWVIDGGTRYDMTNTFDNKATWKAGTAYTVRSTGTTFHGNYGTSFRQPTVSNLYNPTYGNRNLKPEEGWTAQGGIRQPLFDGKLQLEATAWYTDLTNAIAYQSTGSGTGQYVNRDKQITQGVETQFRWAFYDNMMLVGNYTYTDSETEKSGKTYRTVQIARNSGMLGLESNWDKLFLALYGYYQGPRLRWNGDVDLPSYFRGDLAARYKLGKGFTAYTRINNLFNENHSEDPYESMGFNIVCGLSWEFSAGQ